MTQEEAIDKLYKLSKEKFNLEVLDDNWHGFTKALCKSISNDKNPVCRLQRKRDKLKMDYEDISRPYVRGESYGSEGGGSPINSWHISVEENLHIERLKIEEEISKITIEQRILEEQLKDEFEAFELLCQCCITNSAISEALLLRYLEKKSTSDISISLGYACDTIDQYIFRGIKRISEAIKNQIVKKS